MKFKSKLASALLGTFVLANSAHAAIEDGSGPIGADNVGGSELFFAAYDSSSATTYVRDLGIAFADISSSSSYSFTADTGLSSLIGSPTLSWTLLATDANGTSTGFDPTTYGNRFMATSSSGNSVLTGSTSQQIGTVNQGAVGIDSFVDSNNFLMGGTPADDFTATTIGGGSSAWTSLVSASGTIQGSTGVTGGLGDTLAFYLYSTTGTVGGFGSFTFYTAEGVAAALLGDWTLGNDGLLTFNGASSVVPVPAAVWLFASALLGLVGVSRRKQQVALS